MWIFTVIKILWNSARFPTKLFIFTSLLILASVWFAPSSDAQAGRFAFWIIYNIAALIILIITMGIKGLFESDIEPHLQSPETFWLTKLENYKRDKAVMNIYRKDIEMPSPYSYAYRTGSSVWNNDGYWQNQWRAYKNGNPSVYNDPMILPKGYTWTNPQMMNFWFYDSSGQKITACKTNR